MKQVFRTQQGIKVVDVQIPSINENEVLVKVHRSMISTGTETMTLRKEQVSLSNKLKTHKKNLDKLKKMVLAEGFGKSYKFIKYKLKPSPDDIDLSPIGYSNSGVIVATGSKVMNFNIGDRVACAGSGIAAHAEYVAVPRNLVVAIPENVTFEQAAFTTIGSIAIQGLRRANVTFGDTIVITGLGLIGLLSVQIAKAWGLTVIALDIDDSRIALAKQLGADYAYNAILTELDSIIKSLTSGNGADAVVICAATKSNAPVNQAMHLCRRKGTVTIVGSVGMNVERDQMYLKEIDLLMSTSYGPGRYDDQYEKAGIDYPIGYVKWTE
ncbi:MAG: zinc-binding alcohol dehydrogenase, partial [Candidatus Cloacimonetes bacterium]|nr:zinc-binding alcohol dehydrogenase [Candidatus Cloacimonadota bacterium]